MAMEPPYQSGGRMSIQRARAKRAMNSKRIESTKLYSLKEK